MSMKLLFRTNRGYMFGMEADTLPEIKLKVTRYTGVPSSNQIHRYETVLVGIGGVFMINLEITGDYDVPWPEYIFIRMPALSTSFNLKFLINQTVERLKKKIQELVADTPFVGHVVVIKNYQTGIELQPDHATLLECKLLLSPDVTVEFRSQMVLNVYFPELGGGSDAVMTVDVHQSILGLREGIRLELRGKGMLAPLSSILLKDERGMVLPDGSNVSQCQIRENSTLTVEFRPQMNVVVNFPGTAICPVAVRYLSSMDTIEEVKEHVETMRGIPKERMVVREEENGEELPNEKRLLYCKISFSVEIPAPPPPPPSGQE